MGRFGRVLVGVALGAGGLGAGVTAWMERVVAPPPSTSRPLAAVAPPSHVVALSLDDTLEQLINGNLFDASLRGTWGRSTPGPPPSGLPLTLLGTLADDSGLHAVALIVEHDDPHSSRGVRVGDSVLGLDVRTIEKKRVGLGHSDDALTWLVVEEDDIGQVERAPQRGASAGIESLGEDRWAVDRSMLEAQLADLEGITRMARAQPHRGEDGTVDGFRLVGVRGLPATLGVKSGDVVHAVNGTSLDSAGAAAQALQQLQDEPELCLDVTRRGEALQLCYEVR